ncbi:uncharacterized protein LOC143459118 [Clavelina lepadiformis]|uniref:uncharacterized protein LOC143459118 n=1 Tax=Clavelina lepadiformis TaxID=159417 RepID=UPI004041067E
MSQNPNVNFQGSTIHNARVVGSQGVNYAEQNESGIRLDNEGTMNMRDVIRGNSENVFANEQRIINQASGSYYQEGQVTGGVSVTNNVVQGMDNNVHKPHSAERMENNYSTNPVDMQSVQLVEEYVMLNEHTAYMTPPLPTGIDGRHQTVSCNFNQPPALYGPPLYQAYSQGLSHPAPYSSGLSHQIRPLYSEQNVPADTQNYLNGPIQRSSQFFGRGQPYPSQLLQGPSNYPFPPSAPMGGSQSVSTNQAQINLPSAYIGSSSYQLPQTHGQYADGPPIEKRRRPNNGSQQNAVISTSPTMQDRQQQFNLSQSTSSSSATVTENPTVREQRNVSQGKGSSYHQGPANKVVNINDNRIYNQPWRSSGQEQNRSLEELRACLRDAIEQAARKNTAYIPSPLLEQDLSFVVLDITSESKPNNLDESVMSNLTRENIMKAFKPSKGNMDLSKLFERSKKRKCYCRNPYCHNSIGIVGQAGIGKTTLSMHLTKSLLDAGSRNTTSKQNKKINKKFDYVFFIQFRKMNFKTSYKTLLHFLLLSSSVNNWKNHSGNNDKLLLQYLNGDESSKPSVILIMDGFDEAIFRDLKSAPLVTLFQEATAEDFIKNIISGHLLGHAVKFITSRPHRIYEMHRDCQPHFVYRIVGLGSESQNKLCQQICKDYSDRVGQYLENHPDIQAYCYVPINCILTLHCIKIGLAKEGSYLNVNTVTDVILKTFEWFLESENMRLDRDCIGREVQKICRFALNCFKNQRIIFYAKDFTLFEIGSQTIQAFVHSHVDDNLRITVLKGKELYYFSHLIWQEFFSAIALLFVDDNFKQHEPEFSDGRWEVVLKFAFGLSNPKISRLVQTILFDGSVIGSVSSKNTSSLQQFAKNAIAKVYKKNTNEFSKRVTFKSVLQFCVWAHEAQNETLQKLIAAALPLNIVFSGNCIAGDIASLNYVLCACVKRHTVDVKLKFIGNAGKRFLQKIPQTLRRSNSYVKTLKITGCDIGDDGFKAIFDYLDNLEEIYMIKCNITEAAVRELAKVMKDLQNLPEVFDISYGEMDSIQNRWFQPLKLGRSIDPTQKYHGAGLTAAGLEALSVSIKKIAPKMKKLNLCGNVFGDDGASHISTCLSKIEELDIGECNISASGIKSISDVISKLPEPIHYLNLSGNNFGDAGVRFIMSCLDKIDKLYMTDCNITEEGVRVIIEHIKNCSNLVSLVYFLPKVLNFNYDEMNRSKVLRCGLDQLGNGNFSNLVLTPVGVKALATAINKLPESMKKLDLRRNNLGDDGASHISTCLSKIEELDIGWCNIRASGIKSISDAISKLPEPMKKLDLRRNNLGDDGASHISTCLSKIEELDIGWCNIRASGIKSISDAISKLPEPMKKLYLSFNYLGDDGASHISTCLSKIEELHISGCNISASGIKSISDAISKLPEPMKKLYLWGNNLGDDGASHISTCLSKIEELHISGCKIRASGIKSISDAISKLPEPMKKLDLRVNNLGDDGASHISTCLSKIEELDIGRCNISASGIKSISDVISKLPEPIHYLNLSGNNFGDAGVPFIMSCLDKIEKLNMTDCNITEEGVRVITEHIKNCSNLPKVLNFNYDEMNRSNVLRCGLDQLDNGNFKNLDLTAVVVEAFAAAINKLPEPMKKLDLRGNNLGDDGASHISTCLSKIEELVIGECNISASGIKSISDAISKLPEPMKKLNLYGNNLGDDGASHISTCLSKIEELHIGRCKISASGIKSISDAISKLPEPMKKLDLRVNNLGDDGASHISTCLSKIEELDIGRCNISESGIKSISDAISKLPEPMKKLDLWDNNLGDDGASHISNCLSKIEELDIGRCKIRASGIKSISDAISKLPEPMKKLDLWDNNLGDDGASHISTCLSKIEVLGISRCKIRASGIKSISDAISKLPEPMKKLDVSWNNLGDDGASHISTCLSKIEELDIGRCRIRASGIKSISDAISKLPEPMKKLNLCGNVFGDDGASHISTCLSKIEELHIGQCNISASGIKSISDAISKLPEPIHYLNLSGNKFGDAGAPFIMSCLNKIEKLYMTDCNITEEGVRVIIELCSNLPKVLNFNYDEMNRSNVLRCCLDLLGNGNFSNLVLTPVGVKALAATINKLPESMKKLNLRDNNLGDDAASHISTCLSKIEELDIGQCNISASGIKSISDAISKLPEPMKKLNLWGNNLGDDGASHISTCLSKIEELDIGQCNISASGIKSISDAISKLPEPMKKLDLYDNNLGDDGASHISTCLSKIEELDISQCNISASGIKSISDAISKLPEPIRYLNLSGNKFAGVPFIMSCLDKIEKLYMTNCNITEEGVRVITKHIKNCSNLPKVLNFNYDEMNRSNVLRCGLDLLGNGNFRNLGLTPVGWEALAATVNKLPEPMKKLCLSFNGLGDDGASHISTCLSKIEKLYIGQCKISASGIKSISDAISKLPEPMKELDLWGNNLGDDGASHISTCLSKIEELDIGKCNISASGIKSISDAISKLLEPMKKLYLSGNYLGDDGASYISTCLSKIEELDIGYCKISAPGIKSISDAISKLPEPMKKLVLWNNNLGDRGASHISTCLSKIEELNIGECNISASGIKSISDAIFKLPEPMKELNLCRNEFGDDGASHISTCLSKIEKLHINKCNISASGIKSISDAISKLPEPMKKLVLRDNNLGDDGASHISTCLSKIEKLHIGECKISASGIKSISDAISKLPEPMKKLHLWDNNLGDDGASHISTCLSKIEELDIGECKIRASGIKSISDAISKLPEPMKKLYLSSNNLGNDEASHISTCLGKIEELHIGWCKISASGIKSISDAISKLPEPMKELDISWNNLCDDGASHISTCLSKIEELDISKCNISASGIKSISDAISKLPEPMKKFDLFGNNLGDDGASHISTCLSKIEELHIGWCDISASGIKCISDAISKLPQPMKKLNLWSNNLGDDGASHISTCLSKIEELNIGLCKISASGIKCISDAISKLPEPRITCETINKLKHDIKRSV